MDVLITWIIGLLFLLIFQYFVFVFSYSRKRIDAIDIFWSLSFIAVGFLYVFMNMQKVNVATVLSLFCVAVWGIRLATHIYIRFKAKNVQDKRYTDITESFINKPLIVYIKVFAVQAFLASLVTVVLLSSAISSKYNLLFVAVGFVFWLFGFVFESVSDMQLKNHIANNNGSLIKTGLWKYSRHPNYFGEIVQWWAVWIMSLGGEFALLGVVGPLTITVLIVFISGIPILEKNLARKEGWEEYKKSTPILIPGFHV